MTDGIHVNIRWRGTLADMNRIDRDATRGTMWALREVGRRVKREARKAAPVYTGDDPRAQPREYMNSIRSSKRLKNYGRGTYGLKVGPRGAHVHLYAVKVEQQYRPMQTGYQRTLPEIRALHEKAWNRAIHRGRR